MPAGRDPAQGIVITLPPHTGPGTLTFDLHARHMYSEDEMKPGKAYARYPAVIGVLTMKGDLLDRGAVEAEFRTRARSLRSDRRRRGTGQPEGGRAARPGGDHRFTMPAKVDAGQPARRNRSTP